MNWKDILKGEELNPNVRSLDAKEQKEIKEEIIRLGDLYYTESLNPEREKMVIDRIKELSAQVDIKPKRMRPQNENDKTLNQLDIMEAFRDYVIKNIGHLDGTGSSGDKMPKVISVIQYLKKLREGYYLDISHRITPAEFVQRERKVAEAIIEQIVDTLKVFPNLEVTEKDRRNNVYYTDKFIEWAKSKLPRLTTSIATD